MCMPLNLKLYIEHATITCFSLLVASKVCGFHIYTMKYVKEELQCVGEEDNDHDPFSVSVMKIWLAGGHA